MASRTLLICCFLMVTLVGCGGYGGAPPNQVSLKGKVLLPDGKAVPKGTILFEPEDIKIGQEVFSQIQNGNFELNIVPGKYRVAIEPPSKRQPGSKEGSPIPRMYQEPKTSKIETEVLNGTNPDFEVKLGK